MGVPSWVPGDEVRPAPLPLLLVQCFVNTWESDSGVDLLSDPPSAERWLADAGLLRDKSRLTVTDLAAARDVRESIRALLVYNGGGPAPGPSELAALQELGRDSRFAFTFTSTGRADLEPVGDRPLELARLLVIIRDSQQDGTWARLKACHNCECRWAFYDRSHAGRGAWCDMSVCGNRVKNRKLRARKAQTDRSSRTTPSPTPSTPLCGATPF
jgi:predicted RNA-binding Zn ribbon-like protein